MKWLSRKKKKVQPPVFTSAEVIMEMMKRDLAGPPDERRSACALMTPDQARILLTELFGGQLPEEIAFLFEET
jgi:hypothetical protein